MLFESYELNFLSAFLFTLLIEGIIVYYLYNPDKKTTKIKKLIPVIIFVNLITLPLVWFVFPLFFLEYTSFIILAELFAFIAEALLYSYFFRLNIKEALKISFLANLASFLFGFLFF